MCYYLLYSLFIYLLDDFHVKINIHIIRVFSPSILDIALNTYLGKSLHHLYFFFVLFMHWSTHPRGINKQAINRLKNLRMPTSEAAVRHVTIFSSPGIESSDRTMYNTLQIISIPELTILVPNINYSRSRCSIQNLRILCVSFNPDLTFPTV